MNLLSSGITPNILKGVQTTLEEIQATLLLLICKDDILIGHSLENDLRVLRLNHETIIDTAILFRSQNGGRKHSLKHLSLCLLKQKIQEAKSEQNQLGHDSIEDAAASLILALRRAKLGRDKFQIYDKRDHKIHLLETITKIQRKRIHDQPMFFQRHMNGFPIICLGPNEWVKEHVAGQKQSSAHALQCDNIKSSSIKAVSSYLRPGSRSAGLLWAKICVNIDTDEDFELKIDTE